MHASLKAPRSMKRRTTSPQFTPNSTPLGTPNDIPGSPASIPAVSSLATLTPSSIRSPTFKPTDSDTRAVSSLTLQEEDDSAGLSSESEYILSDPTGFRSPELSPDKKVQFVIGIDDIPEDGPKDSEESTPSNEKQTKYKRG